MESPAPPQSLSDAGPAGNAAFIEDAEELEELEAVPDTDAFSGMDAAPRPPQETGFSGAGWNPRQGGLLQAAERKQFQNQAKKNKKISNVRLAFGDDDIPYIVETSGIEIVDDEDIDNAIRAMQDDDSAGVEELEGPESFEYAGGKPASPPSAREIADIVSEIEFGLVPETDLPEEDAQRIAATPLEVVSPFASMLSPLDISAPSFAGGEPDETGGPGPEYPAADGEDLSLPPDVPPEDTDNLAAGMPVMYRPFQDPSGLEPELLQGADEDASQAAEAAKAAGAVIVQQNGIHYINNDVINQHNEENLDSGFRELVESVVTKN